METQVLGAALTIAVALIMWQLRALSNKIDRAEDRADKRAAEDRAANKADHDKLFLAVASLQGDVKVLRDRSDRSGRSDSAAG